MPPRPSRFEINKISRFVLENRVDEVRQIISADPGRYTPQHIKRWHHVAYAMWYLLEYTDWSSLDFPYNQSRIDVRAMLRFLETYFTMPEDYESDFFKYARGVGMRNCDYDDRWRLNEYRMKALGYRYVDYELSKAVERQDLPRVFEMLQAGGDPKLRLDDNKTPDEIAGDDFYESTLEYLLRRSTYPIQFTLVSRWSRMHHEQDFNYRYSHQVLQIDLDTLFTCAGYCYVWVAILQQTEPWAVPGRRIPWARDYQEYGRC